METKTDPKFSIITPSYNQVEYIEDTIVSVANQNYNNTEHIVIDGDSTDGTLDILKQYDQEIEWTSEPDNGQSDAINKGFDRASGDIVGWLNSDDVYFDINVLQRVKQYFENSDADVVYGDIAIIGPKSEILALQTVPNFDYKRLLRGCFIEQPALFFRSSVLEGERLDTNLEYVMDYEFWLRLAKKYEFSHVKDVLAGDRNHSNRKIIKGRSAMQKEAQQIASEYGSPTHYKLTIERGIDRLISGIPRALQAILYTAELHRNPPELAFNGQFRPLATMILNVFYPNRYLVPDS